MPHLFVVTYGTAESQLYFLRRSAALQGIKVINLATSSSWEGYQDKLWGVRDFILQREFDPEDRILFVDAYDVLLSGTVEEMWQAYRAYNSPEVLIAAEKNCYPYEDMAEDYPTVSSPYRFLNSGGFMGTPSGILEMINWMEDGTVKEICRVATDQGYVVRYFLEHHDKRNIKLDTHCLLFNCMIKVSWEKEIRFEKGRFVNVEMRSKPAVLHFNGGTYWTADHNNVMQQMLEFMEGGLDGDLKRVPQPPF